MLESDKVKAFRELLFKDFEFYAKHALKIRTKAATIAPFILNRAQKRLLEVAARQLATRGFIRIILLKGRQMGSSTFVEGFLYWWTSQRQATRALVVAHDGEATKVIFQMTKNFHNMCPDMLRPSTVRSTVKELVFDKLLSSYRIATAGGDGIVRGETIQAAHLSEFAWWPPGSAESNFSGLMDAIPPISGTCVFIESTANGFNIFHQQWERAENGLGLFEAVFLPWYWDEGYKLAPPADLQLTPIETDLLDTYKADGLTVEHLMFRRAKVAEKGLELFRQEYPMCAEEAFLTSGYPVFNPDHIMPMLKKLRLPGVSATADIEDQYAQPLLKMELEGRRFRKNRLGRLRVWCSPIEGADYYIGADVSQGVRKDYSVAVVQNAQREIVAIWRCNRTDPAQFGRVLACLGRLYNDAYIACERNKDGILTNYILDKEELYPNIHREKVVDKITEEETEVVGFLTSEKTKPLTIDTLRDHLRDGSISDIPCPVTLKEMLQYIVHENGKMGAEKNHNDDCVIALALANYVNEGEWHPYVCGADNYVSAAWEGE